MSFAATVPRVAVPRHSYNPLEVQRPCIRSLLLLHLEKCQLRPWECGNSEGISKECGKGGEPDSWLSTLSTLCHFHGPLWKRASHNHNHRNARIGNGTTCPNRLDKCLGGFTTGQGRIIGLAHRHWEPARVSS